MDSFNTLLFIIALTFGLAQHLLDREHPPLPVNAKRWWTNGVLFVTETAIITLFAAAIAWLTHADAAYRIAAIAMTGLPTIAQMAILLAVHSFVQYWLHRGSHKIPLLWGWHRIHHSDTRLDATTGLRHHPFESMVDYVAFLVPVMLLGSSAAAVLGYFCLSIAFAMFTHFPPRWLPAPVDIGLSRIIMTPRLHQLHHSNWQSETDMNYGNIVTVWDRVFGTFLPAPLHPRPGFKLGLNEFPLAKAQDPFLQLAAPFLAFDQRDKATDVADSSQSS